jgi:hypothetical protein
MTDRRFTYSRERFMEGCSATTKTHVDVQDLADGSGESTLRSIGRALHEHDEGVLLDGLGVRGIFAAKD